MTVEELIAHLGKLKAEYPGRKLTVQGRDQKIRVCVALGRVTQLSADGKELGVGVGSTWIVVEIPDCDPDELF